MIRLFASELLRARSRRMLWMISVGCAIAIVVGVGIATIRSQPPTAEEVAAAQRQYEIDFQHCSEGRFVSEDRLPKRYATLEEYCTDQVRPEFYETGSDELRLNGLIGILKGSSFFVIIIGLFLGASFGGADWHTGTMATLLTWEPRRLRVMLARAIVTAAVVLLLALAVQALLAGTFWLGATIRGSTELLGEGFWRDAFETMLRVGAIAVAAAVIGLGLATIGRNTAAAIMVLFGYLALFEVLFRGLRPTIAGWLLITNMAVAVDANQIEIDRDTIITVAHAGVVVAIWAAAVAALGALAFRTRDVT